MEKINSLFEVVKNNFLIGFNRIKEIFIKKKTEMTQKKDVDFKNLSILFFSLVSIFIALGLFMPSDDGIVFRQVAKDLSIQKSEVKKEETSRSSSASKVWSNSRDYGRGQYNRQNHAINYNTAMTMEDGHGNSKYELPAGTKFKIQILEKFIASQEGTPVIAKLIESVTSASGNEIPEGSLLYGEAVYQNSSEKALITFKQVSYPNGSQHVISARALGEDGLVGISGNVKSDSIKNSAGQVITNFVGGLAAGSVERDFLGHSKGGTTNGLYQAIAEAAKDRAQKFGEELKESREWIEVEAGVIGEAILQSPYKLMSLDMNNNGNSL